MSQDNISFDLPKNRSNVIKVIGVGGGGSNAVNYMYKQGFNGVDFVVCNTDAQALHSSPVPNKIQLGVTLTEGLGAGAHPEIGGEAAEESIDDIKAMLTSNTKMIFLTAGMGGGTGTGAAPVIAKLAAELGILTVGIVTMPFQFEGKGRLEQAQIGVERLREHVDSLIVINNSKLREVYGNLGYKAGFAKADEVLATAAKGISEVITTHYGMNIDLRDAKTVLENSGTAIMGSAEASGENRAMDAIVRSLDSPLLNDNRITGAKGVLLLIVSGETEITIDEIAEINNYIQSESGGNSNIIMGVGEEEGLRDSIRITVVATGFTTAQQDVQIEKEPQKRVHVLTDDNSKGKVIIKKELETVAVVKKDVPEPVTPSMEKKVVHILEDEVEEVENTYVNTVEEEKPEYIVDNDAVEKDIMSIADDEILISDIDNSQTTIEFDFGSIENSASVDANIEEEIVSIESHVDDSLEDFEEEIIRDLPYLKPEINNKSEEISEKQPEKFTDGSIRYNLQDFEDLEDKINDAKPTSTIVEKVEEEELEPELQIHIVKNTVVEPELELKQKVVENKVEEPIATEDLIDPTDVPLSKREQIGKERRERLKKFNHRFKSVNVNSSTIDDLEKQPAYKRAGIDVTSSQSRNGNSRYSLGNNGDDDVVIRPNNSFLHDNVD